MNLNDIKRRFWEVVNDVAGQGNPAYAGPEAKAVKHISIGMGFGKYMVRLEDDRIYSKIIGHRDDKWFGAGVKAFHSPHLDRIVADAEKNGLKAELSSHEKYLGRMRARFNILMNGTDEQVARLEETHPVLDPDAPEI